MSKKPSFDEAMRIIQDPTVVLECDEEVLDAMVQWMTGPVVTPTFGELPCDQFIYDPSKARSNT